MACIQGNKKLAKHLIDLGADVDALDLVIY
jgi:hypothetical protein